MALANRIRELRRAGLNRAATAAVLNTTVGDVAEHDVNPGLPEAPITGASDIAFAFATNGSPQIIPGTVVPAYHEVGLNGYNGWTTFNDPDTFELLDATDGVADIEGPLRIKRPGVYDIFLSAYTTEWLPVNTYAPIPRMDQGDTEMIFGTAPPVTVLTRGDTPNKTVQFIWQQTYVGNITAAPVDLVIPWATSAGSTDVGIAFDLFIKRVGETAGEMSP